MLLRFPFALSAAKGLMKLWGSFATIPLMPRGSHFSCFVYRLDTWWTGVRGHSGHNL